jgi:ribonuclease BN (tRNA processing enzyme)
MGGGRDVLVIPLGSRGWMPQGGRQTVCTFVRLGEARFLLDCGTGASRLREPALREHLGGDGLTVLFSHYHLDHFAGLAYLPGLLAGLAGPIRLAGPARGLTGAGLREACGRLTSPPLSSQPWSAFPFPLEIVEFGPAGVEIDGVRIRPSLQEHPGGSVALRLDDALCYATDLAAATPALPLADGVQLLIHEAWEAGALAPAGSHSGFAEALARARRAGVPRLLPLHFSPNMTEDDIRALGNLGSPDLQVLVPEEGTPIRFALPAE